MVAAGQRVTAAAVTFFMDSVLLPDNHAQSVAATYQDWGSTIIIPNPGINVKVTGMGQGYGFYPSGATNPWVGLRVAISSTGGSTFDFGQESRDEIDINISRGGTMVHHFFSGTPTGDIVVKLQHSAESTIPTFFGGRLTAFMVPA